MDNLAAKMEIHIEEVVTTSSFQKKHDLDLPINTMDDLVEFEKRLLTKEVAEDFVS